MLVRSLQFTLLRVALHVSKIENFLNRKDGADMTLGVDVTNRNAQLSSHSSSDYEGIFPKP